MFLMYFLVIEDEINRKSWNVSNVGVIEHYNSSLGPTIHDRVKDEKRPTPWAKRYGFVWNDVPLVWGWISPTFYNCKLNFLEPSIKLFGGKTRIFPWSFRH